MCEAEPGAGEVDLEEARPAGYPDPATATRPSCRKPPRPAPRLAAANPPARPAGLALALSLAAPGWHILPLSPATKGPLGNCPACRDTSAGPHRIEDCPCIPAGRWCHGVRAATTGPDRLTAWWRDESAAVPGVAAGPSGLVLIDIDAHRDELPPDLTTGLLPGIDLAADPTPRELRDDPGRFRDASACSPPSAAAPSPGPPSPAINRS